jgi:hypothetical protein
VRLGTGRRRHTKARGREGGRGGREKEGRNGGELGESWGMLVVSEQSEDESLF